MIPIPIQGMPSQGLLMRAAVEECTDALDHVPGAIAIEETPVALPDGSVATLRCTRTKAGLRISIRVRRYARR